MGYRGEVMLVFKDRTHSIQHPFPSTPYKVGDRIGQLMIIPYPKIEFKLVDKLSKTERGDGGFGSTN